MTGRDIILEYLDSETLTNAYSGGWTRQDSRSCTSRQSPLAFDG